MNDSQSPVVLVDGSTGQVVEAVLCHKITNKHLRDYETLWRPWLEATKSAHLELPRQESAHWEWRKKMDSFGGMLGFPSFAIEANGETQGLMILNLLESCRLPCQKNKPLVYIEFLETATWNRVTLTKKPRFKRVGPVLVNVAIQVSIQEEFEGRIGLHSLPQSDAWYRDKCRMEDLGPDKHKQDLRYFEMTVEQARTFLRKGK